MTNTHKLINKALDSVVFEPGDLGSCVASVKKLISMLKRCTEPKMYDKLHGMLTSVVDCLDPDQFTEELSAKALLTIADILDYAEKELLKLERPEGQVLEALANAEQIDSLNRLLKNENIKP